MEPNEFIHLLDGRKMTENDLYKEAIRLDPGYSSALMNLGCNLSPTETTVLLDGRVMGKRQLYLEGLKVLFYCHFN
jgi:hypothetical protein